jgi:protein SCO1/2
MPAPAAHPARARRRPLARAVGALAIAAATLLTPAASAQLASKDPPPELQGLELDQHPGAQAPADLVFTRSDGTPVKLGDYFNRGRPVVLSLVYFKCPMICPLTLTRLTERLNGVGAAGYEIGKDYDVVVISFDHRDTARDAQIMRDAYALELKQERSDLLKSGFTFHTSDVSNVRLLASAVGFNYRFIPESGQFAHASALVVLTPEGKVARYLDGLSGDGKELRMALLEASQGKVSKGLADFFLHKCYIWDPKTGKYTISAFRLMQAGGFLTATAIAVLVVGLRAGERARAHRRERSSRASSRAAEATPPAHAMGQAT